ncbi:Holliday junction resolvase RuvX [Olivibacter sitiensis]|uniref:Holliday junction resolvase RuvX n=1 Tax=Olivibacter sitiensis TaxID=376470 RepID=UPI00055B2CA1|nr:Holliday junction resolvase RuvX [Olivibacter sitiensis]
MRIMAFDYGTKRVGIAVTDPLKIIATALDTVHPKDLIEYLKRYLLQEPVETFVVGMSSRLDGSPTHSTPHIKGFITTLKKHFPHIPIAIIDERFTSKIASASIAQSNMGRIKRQDKSLIDKVSAVIILQDYMKTLESY